MRERERVFVYGPFLFLLLLSTFEKRELWIINEREKRVQRQTSTRVTMKKRKKSKGRRGLEENERQRRNTKVNIFVFCSFFLSLSRRGLSRLLTCRNAIDHARTRWASEHHGVGGSGSLGVSFDSESTATFLESILVVNAFVAVGLLPLFRTQTLASSFDRSRCDTRRR